MYFQIWLIQSNLTATIPVHMPQSAIILNIFGGTYNIYEKDWLTFDWENFILDFFSVNWEDLFKIN